jgi:hypothetical protein
MESEMNRYQLQEMIEAKFSKRNIADHVRTEIMGTDGIRDILKQGAGILREYINEDHGYASKNARVSLLEDYDLEEITYEVVAIALLMQDSIKFTNMVGRLSEKLHLTNKADGAKCSAEILARLWDLGLYEIYKEEKYGNLKVRSEIAPSKELTKFINQTKFLPPMIVPPMILEDNHSSAYLTRREPLILGGSVNFHNKDICLDSLNKFNQVKLSLNLDILRKYSEEPPKKVAADPKKLKQWKEMVEESYETYLDLVKQGNEFHIPHGNDKRGRTYARGYQVSTQGNKFRKAILDFADKELIEG